MSEFRGAADSVAAHFSFAAIGVEDPHAHIGSAAGHDEDHAVRAHGNPSAARVPRKFSGAFHGVFKSIDHDEIIADSVHLYERNAHHLPSSVTRWQIVSTITSISSTAMHSKRP